MELSDIVPLKFTTHIKSVAFLAIYSLMHNNDVNVSGLTHSGENDVCNYIHTEQAEKYA